MSDTEEKKAGAKDGEEEIDYTAFQQDNEITTENDESKFVVTNPQTVSGHIVYTCKGVDSQGEWEGNRRYNEFFKLHEILEQHFPGIPLPSIPPKKSIGNKDVKFISERRFYLERFMKKIAPYKFVIESQPFQIFARPNGDIDKQLMRLPKQKPEQIIERYKAELGLDNTSYDVIQKDALEETVKGFKDFVKVQKPMLDTFIKKISAMMTNYSQGIVDQKNFLNMLDKYEELNLSNYLEGETTKMVFGNPQTYGDSDASIKELVSSTCGNLKNPFFNMYHWAKGEKADVSAIVHAVEQKEKMAKKIKENTQKKASTQTNLDNVTAGKKTVKTLFKSEKDAGDMASSIENTERDIENYTILHELIIIYLGETVIPTFKTKKAGIYVKILQQFNVMQINNTYQVASFWSNILSNPNIKQAIEDEQNTAQE